MSDYASTCCGHCELREASMTDGSRTARLSLDGFVDARNYDLRVSPSTPR